MLALASPELEILGLTTVFGNVSVAQGSENALRLLHLAGKPDIPVSMGASQSWKSPYGGPKAFIHGEDGQGNTWSDPAPQAAIDIPAAQFIVDQVQASPGNVTIVALGPLTNLADALKLSPEIQNKLKEVVFMGGNAFGPGNNTPAAEANMFSDPDAADFVMGHALPMTMVGLDVTEKTLLTRQDIEELASKPSKISAQVFSAYRFYLDFYKRENKMDGTWVHDSSALTYLLQRDLYKTVSCPIRVETEDVISKGKTWPSLKDYSSRKTHSTDPWAARPLITICTDVEAEQAVQLIKESILKTEFPV